MGMFQRSGWDQNNPENNQHRPGCKTARPVWCFPVVKQSNTKTRQVGMNCRSRLSWMDSVLVQSTFTGLMGEICLFVSA
jgi:hypothetical protein